MARYSHQACSAKKIFHAYGMKYCFDGCIECLTITGLRPDESMRSMGQSSTNPCGFESRDFNLSKLTIVFMIMQLTRPSVYSRPVMPIPLAINIGISIFVPLGH
jgi:hypothetical protein